jgi:hypothetical protein
MPTDDVRPNPSARMLTQLGLAFDRVQGLDVSKRELVRRDANRTRK